MRLFETLLVWYGRFCPLELGKWRLVERIWPWVIGSGSNLRTARLKAGGFQMQCDLRLMLQRQFYFYGTYYLERKALERWATLCASADIIFDVGANLGIYSLTAVAANRDARVHAFEPTEKLAQHLRQTLKINDLHQVEVVESAVASSTGTALLNIWGADTEGNEGLNFVTQEAVATKTVPIPTVSLDDYCERQGVERIHLMKIDIQGNEPEALLGAERLLKERRISCIFLELNWDQKSPISCPASRCVDLLHQHGYLFLDPQGVDQAQPAGDWLKSLSDIIAWVPDEK